MLSSLFLSILQCSCVTISVNNLFVALQFKCMRTGFTNTQLALNYLPADIVGYFFKSEIIKNYVWTGMRKHLLLFFGLPHLLDVCICEYK